MITILDRLSLAAADLVVLFWLPLLIWTLLASVVLLLLRVFGTIHVQYQYHIRLALLFALPLGLTLSALGEFTAAWISSGGEPETVLKFIIVQSPVEVSVSNEPANGLLSPAWWSGLGLTFFLSGVLLLIVRHLLQYMQLNHLSRTLPMQPVGSLDKVSRENKTLASGSGKTVYVACTNREIIPVTFGIRKPVVLIPSALTNDPDKMNLVLRHELVHIINHDYLTHLFANGIRILFWVHPLVLVICRQLIEYREMRCDCHVLSDDSVSRKKYATLLLELLPMPNLNKNVSVNMAQESSNLKKRITMIHSNTIRSIPLKASFMLFCGLILSTSLVMSCTDMQSHNALEITSPDAAPSHIRIRPAVEEDFFVVVEDMPELIGGLAAVQETLEYPEEARTRGIEGRVYVQFIVNESGDVENAQVIRGIGGGCDEAALEAVRRAKFKPGMQRGEPVRVQYSLPMVFRLAESSEAGQAEG